MAAQAAADMQHQENDLRHQQNQQQQQHQQHQQQQHEQWMQQQQQQQQPPDYGGGGGGGEHAPTDALDTFSTQQFLRTSDSAVGGVGGGGRDLAPGKARHSRLRTTTNSRQLALFVVSVCVWLLAHA
jgi:hypothetical protein